MTRKESGVLSPNFTIDNKSTPQDVEPKRKVLYYVSLLYIYIKLHLATLTLRYRPQGVASLKSRPSFQASSSTVTLEPVF
jgi:hypothetical protein